MVLITHNAVWLCVCVCAFGELFSKISSWWRRSCWLIQDLLFTLCFFKPSFLSSHLPVSLYCSSFFSPSSFLVLLFFCFLFWSLQSFLLSLFLFTLSYHIFSLFICSYDFVFYFSSFFLSFTSSLLLAHLHASPFLPLSHLPLVASSLKHLSNRLSKHVSTHPDQLDVSWIFSSLPIGWEQWATGVRVLSVPVPLISDFPRDRLCVCVCV